MSSPKPDVQPSISHVTINMSKEEMTRKLKFSCRFCMNELLTQVPLNENTSQRTNLTNAEILQSFTDILVDPSDGLPTMICTKCENMLHLLLIFKNEYLESNKTLRTIRDALNLEEEENAIREEGDSEIDERNTSAEALEVDLETIMCKMEPAIQEVVEDDTIQMTGKWIVDNDSANIQNFDEIQKHTKKLTRNKYNSKCLECGKKMQTPSELTRHMRVHDKEEKKRAVYVPIYTHKKMPGRCPSIMNESNTSLQVDSETVMSEKERTIQEPRVNDTIQINGKRIGDEETTNIQRYNDNRQHTKCGKKVPHMQSYDREHEMRNEWFSCDICYYRSEYKSNVKRHMLVHTNQREFQCDACGKEFIRKDNLAVHKKTIKRCKKSLEVDLVDYLGVPMYVCKVCNKEFKYKHSRDCHQRFHSSKENFTCDICFFRSKYKHNMKRHMLLVHTNQREFKCDACGQRFKREYDFGRHKKRTGRCPYS